jgi:hypothetical protein
LFLLVRKHQTRLSEARQKNLRAGLESIVNQFNMATRYPEEKSLIKKNFTQKFSRTYLKLGEEILTWLDEN